MLRGGFKIFSALILAGLIYFVGFQQACSPVMFQDVSLLTCDEFPSQSRCKRTKISDPLPDRADYLSPDESEPESAVWKYEYEMSLGDLEIVFVLDNSSSMAIEHRSLAGQLARLLSDMKYLRYRFAIITTDISSSPDNPVRGAPYQDGKFIRIGGRLFLENESVGAPPSKRALSDFQQALQRRETQICDTKNQPRGSGNKWDNYYEREESPPAQCPSSDERGTYAINLALKNPAHRSFFSPDVHTMFVIVSDEDVRSGREFINQFDEGEDGPFALEYEDTPESVVETLYKMFPEKTKTASFHPIIIIPRDSACLERQNRYRDRGHGSGRGYYGREYARLADAREYSLKKYGNLLKGSKISICNKNYSSQLGRIALFAERMRLPLPCDESQLEGVQLKVNGRAVKARTEVEGRTLFVTARKDLAISSRVKLEVTCREN